MSMNVAPVKAAMSAVSSVVPKSRTAKVLNLGESIMPKKEDGVNPARAIIIKVLETLAEKSKAKPDAERNIIDYVIILAEKLKDIHSVKYAA